MRMLLTSGFDTYSGYGNDAVDMAVTFQRLGVDVVPWPDSIMPGLPARFTDLLQKDPGGRYDLSVGFAPPFDLKPAKLAPLARTAVGWSMWERTPLLRQDMIGHGWRKPLSRRRYWGPPEDHGHVKQKDKDWLDLMVVTCHDNVEAFQNLDPGVQYGVCPNGIDPDRFPVVDRRGADREFTFASIGMLAGRKDPFATLQAWRLAKEMDPGFTARLVLKTSTQGLHPAIADVYPDVEIINEVWPADRILDFYGRVDCLVSTSRGEGNNKPAMEFMSTGGPVMATNWSGHRNWLHPDTGYPLDGRLVEDPLTGTSNYRVDVDHTARTFLEIFRDQDTARRKGEQAQRMIRAQFSWDNVCTRFLRLCTEVM